MRLKLLFLGLTVVAWLFSYSQQFIPIETKSNLMLLKVDDKNRLQIVYHGPSFLGTTDYDKLAKSYDFRVESVGLVNSPYTPAGVWNFVEPAVAIVHTDGNTSLDLFYQSHQTTAGPDGSTITAVQMRDSVYPVSVTIYYKVWKNLDVVEQWSSIRNGERNTIRLNKFASANLYLNEGNFELTSYSGDWGKELQPNVTKLTQGIHVIESKLGTRQNLYGSQNFMLAINGPLRENEGRVMFGQIAWNGNYKIEFESDYYKNLRIVAGINPYQSAYDLKAGQVFETPKFIYTISNEGAGLASRNLHNWLRDHQLADGRGERLTLLNNWEATYFNFNEAKLVSLFQGAKELGVDMFLLDDGWFGNKFPRNNDRAGLGDWEENRAKLPSGIGYLVSQAENNGIKFGIWIEPEMVNPKSELYEKHKDWVIRQPERPEIYFRNQLVLDLSNPAVQQYVYNIVDDLLEKNPKLAFFKWDCNAPVFNAHSAYLAKQKLPQSHLYVEYTKGLYTVLEKIRAKYPTVPMMLCSGGGGRNDYSLMKYFTEFWPSDMTDPLDRIFIQWQASYFYPGNTVCNHVTAWGKQPIKFKIDVAAMGKLGFDVDVSKLSKEDMDQARQSLADFNLYKHIVWNGDLFRLQSPYEGNYAALAYVSPGKDSAVLFGYLTSNLYSNTASMRPLPIAGLDENKKYRITEMNVLNKAGRVADGNTVYTGAYLKTVGFNPAISLGHTSGVYLIEAVQ